MTPKNQNCRFNFPNDLTLVIGSKVNPYLASVHGIFGDRGNTYVHTFYINEPISIMLVSLFRVLIA